jgi:hypothetical protein
VIDGPVFLCKLGEIAIVHLSVRVRYGETIAIADGTSDLPIPSTALARCQQARGGGYPLTADPALTARESRSARSAPRRIGR